MMELEPGYWKLVKGHIDHYKIDHDVNGLFQFGVIAERIYAGDKTEVLEIIKKIEFGFDAACIINYLMENYDIGLVDLLAKKRSIFFLRVFTDQEILDLFEAMEFLPDENPDFQ